MRSAAAAMSERVSMMRPTLPRRVPGHKPLSFSAGSGQIAVPCNLGSEFMVVALAGMAKQSW
jgi:hypothetical protein